MNERAPLVSGRARRAGLLPAAWKPAIVVAACALAAACARRTAGPEGGTGGGGGITPTGGGQSGAGGFSGGGGSPVTGGAGGEVSGDGPGCNDLQVDFTPRPPTVLFVIDRSSSMSASYAGAGSRWDVLKAAVLDPTNGIVAPLQDQVRFGFMAYTSDNATCPLLVTEEPRLDNYAAINAAYGPMLLLNGKGETPTADALRAATQLLAGITEPGAKAIVLATDGEPDGCFALRDPQCGQDDSISAIQAAYAAGVRTFVIGVTDTLLTDCAAAASQGNNVSECHLQDIANAGAGMDVPAFDPNWRYQCGSVIGQSYVFKSTFVPRDPVDPYAPTGRAPYYHPTDAANLRGALASIIAGIRACTFTLGKTIDVSNAFRGKVLLDGVAVPFGDPDGWSVTDDQTVELHGAACDAIKTGGTQNLYISFPCYVIVG